MRFSCLCPTRSRPLHLEQAIRQFRAQSWPRADRELVIGLDLRASEDDVRVSLQLIAAQEDVSIRAVALKPDRLPALLDHLVREARGQQVVRWDDDDLRHPEYVAHCAGVLDLGCAASFVMDFVHVDRVDGLTTTCRYPWGGGLPGTLACARAAYPAGLGDGDAGGDAAVQAHFLRAASPVSAVGSVVDRPWLYGYVRHGGNLRSAEHHRDLRQRCAVAGPPADGGRLRELGLDEKYVLELSGGAR